MSLDIETIWAGDQIHTACIFPTRWGSIQISGDHKGTKTGIIGYSYSNSSPFEEISGLPAKNFYIISRRKTGLENIPKYFFYNKISYRYGFLFRNNHKQEIFDLFDVRADFLKFSTLKKKKRKQQKNHLSIFLIHFT